MGREISPNFNVMQKDYLEIVAFLKNFKIINTKPYANETKLMPLYKLLRNGSVEISPFDFNELESELIRLSRLHEVFIFQMTVRTHEDTYFRYWFKNGESYSVQGEIIFDDFNIENLK